MATEYNYKIDRMDVVDTSTVSNYVVRVYYSYNGSEGDYSASVSGNVNYKVTEDTIVPFEDLTEETVISWVEATLTDEQKALNKQFVDNAIEKEKNPDPIPEKKDLPW